MQKALARTVLILAAVVAAAAAQAAERRCGWWENPTPANAWLTDKDGEWIVGVQGGHQADGDWPDFSAREWVKTNVNYGYGCACLDVEVDRATKRVLKIVRAQARPLAACRRDRALPRRG
jgi:hypothetical protein